MAGKPYQNTKEIGALIAAFGVIAFFASILVGIVEENIEIAISGIVGSVFMILMGDLAGVVVGMARDVRRMAGEPPVEQIEPTPPPPPQPPPPPPPKPKPRPTVVVEGKVICGRCRESFRLRPGSATVGETFACPMCGERSLVT